MIGIYKIECNKNHKVYIGQSVDVFKRWNDHICDLNKNRHINKKLQNSWNKYGECNFSFQVVEECKNRKELNEKETYWFAYYKNILGESKMLNIAQTGNAHNTSEYARRKISKKLKGRVFTQEWKEKISNSKKGRTISEEQRKAISQANKNKIISAETRAKMSKAQKGKKVKDEVKQFLSISRKGKHFSPKTEFTKGRCSGANNPRAYGVYQYTLDLCFVAYYKTATEASQKTEINRGLICNCRCGTKKTAGGFIWKKESV